MLARWRARATSLAQRLLRRPPVQVLMAAMAQTPQAGLLGSSLAFRALFAILGFLLLLAGVGSWLVTDPALQGRLLDTIAKYFPPLADLVGPAFSAAKAVGGFAWVVGILGLLWGVSGFYEALEDAMFFLFPGGQRRGFFARRIRGGVMIALFIAALAALSSVTVVLALLPDAGHLWSLAALAALVGLLIAGVLALYTLVPTAAPTIREALPVAVLVGAAVGILTWLFSFVATWLVGQLVVFGAIAGIFGTLLWLNLVFQAIAIGATVVRFRRDARDSGQRSGPVGNEHAESAG